MTRYAAERLAYLREVFDADISVIARRSDGGALLFVAMRDEDERISNPTYFMNIPGAAPVGQ